MPIRWFVIHVYSGFEKKIADHIMSQSKKLGLSHLVNEVLVPSQETLEVRQGRKILAEHKFFPGYVLIKMELTDDTWHLVRNTPKVTGFLGSKLRPTPISDAEAERIIRQSSESSIDQTIVAFFQVGEQIKVSDGPFASFAGTVEDVDHERQRLKVSVSIFGRSTPVDLEFSQVEKI
jgi:transcriptional antiterminator NusG